MVFIKPIVAVVTSIIFAAVASAIDYTPISERQENHYYYSYPSLLAGGMLFITPMFICFGIPIALFTEKVVKQFKPIHVFVKYLIVVMLYAIGGVLSTFVLMFIISRGDFGDRPALWGVLWSSIPASMLFLHFSILVDVKMKKCKGRLINRARSN